MLHLIISIYVSDFIWDFGKLPFPTHLGKYFIKIGKIRAKIHEIGKIKAIFGLGMTPIYGLKNGQIKSLYVVVRLRAGIVLCFATGPGFNPQRRQLFLPFFLSRFS